MVVVGIDVGKSELYACLLRAVSVEQPEVRLLRQTVKNTPEGHASLQDWLTAQDILVEETSVVMESTGVYGERIALKLHLAGYRVSVVNAAQIKFYAKSMLRRGKTDKMDAELIAQYGQKMHPARWMPPEHAEENLRALIHEREAVIALITAEKGRQHALDYRLNGQEVVVKLGRERLALLEEQRRVLETAMETCMAESSELGKRVQLLTSIPGVGKLTAAIVLAETSHLEKMKDSRQWAAYAGLSPVPRQSGAMTGRCRISKVGNARLRRAFYLSAVTGTRLDNAMGEFYRRLVAAGKPKKVALIALPRKILRTCFAVLRSQIPFDPAYQRPTTHA